jgi:hypothetical protein
MISLLDSDKFKTEYNSFKQRINEIPREDLKKKGEELLNRLVGEIKFLDTQHRELFTTHKMPMRLEESKKKITDIRKDLDRFLKDCSAIKA